MIVSFSRNYIFIRTKKTASSTIENVLKDSLAPGDIAAGKTASRLTADRAGPFELGEEDLYAHMKASDIRTGLSPEFWDRAFKFTSERHPYEKAVSLAFYRYGKRERIAAKKGKLLSEDFAVVLDETVRTRLYRSFNFYAIDGRVVVDDFIRHETLETDLQRIGKRIGLEIPHRLPRKKASYKLDERPAAEILSDEQRQIIFDTCREEFDLLGYNP
jgi:hypothetical protein